MAIHAFGVIAKTERGEGLDADPLTAEAIGAQLA
jgi:hypothetical protein